MELCYTAGRLEAGQVRCDGFGGDCSEMASSIILGGSTYKTALCASCQVDFWEHLRDVQALAGPLAAL